MSPNNRPFASFPRVLGLCLLAAVPAAQVWAGSSGEAREWFSRMTRATQTLNYDATFVYMQGRRLEAMRIIHGADGDGERERMISLSGSPREIIRDSSGVAYILPNRNSIIVEGQRARTPFVGGGRINTEQVAQYYDFLMVGSDRMAGHKAKVIAIRPKDQYRYGYRLWLDERSGMLLKSELISTNGAVLEQVMLTNFNLLDEVPSSALEPSLGGEGFVWAREPKDTGEAVERGDDWQATRLPDGFALTLHERHRLPEGGTPVEHLLFGDGLASVSVFIEKMEEGSKHLLKGASHVGAVNAYGTVVAGHQVTAVGEVPQATVSLIGQSVQYNPAGGKARE